MTSKAKFGLGIGVALLVSCGFGGARLLQFVDYPIASGELDSAVKEARNAGVPLTAADLVSRRFPSANPATVSWLEATWTTNDDLVTVHAELTSVAPDWKKAAQLVGTYSKDLAKLRHLVRSGALIEDKDWDLGPEVLFPELAAMKSAAKALCSAALVQARQGDFDGAARDLALSRRLGEISNDIHCLVGVLVHIAMDAITMRTAELCLTLAESSPAAIQKVRDSVLIKEGYDFHNAIRSEAFMGVTVTRNLDKFGGVSAFTGTSSGGSSKPLNPKTLRRSGEPTGMVQRAYMARSLQFWTKALTFSNRHPDDLIAVSKELDRLAQEEETNEKGLSYVLNRILNPVFAQAGAACLKGVADVRCKRALSHVVEYRAKNVRFPAKLSAVGSFIDPFTGDELKTKVAGGRYRVWSVGPDGVDNGGVSQAERKGSSTKAGFDIVAAYPFVGKK